MGAFAAGGDGAEPCGWWGDVGAGTIWAELRAWGAPGACPAQVPSSGSSQLDPRCFPVEATPAGAVHPSPSWLFGQKPLPTSVVTSGPVITIFQVMGSFWGPLLALEALQRDLQPLGSCAIQGTSTSDGLCLIYLLLQVSHGTFLPLFK